MASRIDLPRDRAAPPPGAARLEAGEATALAGLAFLLVVTVLWWTLALWPPPADAPAWIQAARAVCFGAHDDGLPGAGGWILLVGEPLGMATALALVWPRALGAGLRKLAARGWGRALLVLSAAVLLAGAGLAGRRVAGATGPSAAPAAAVLRPMDTPAPTLALVDQRGARLDLARFRGRSVLVTFAFAHCETVCPLLVHDALRVQREASPAPALVVVTLDPWRDTPARLPAIAHAWALGDDAFVVSGPVAEVAAVHAAWGVSAARDRRTGSVTHPPLTFVIDPAGRLRFTTTGTRTELAEALRRLPAR